MFKIRKFKPPRHQDTKPSQGRESGLAGPRAARAAGLWVRLGFSPIACSPGAAPWKPWLETRPPPLSAFLVSWCLGGEIPLRPDANDPGLREHHPWVAGSARAELIAESAWFLARRDDAGGNPPGGRRSGGCGGGGSVRGGGRKTLLLQGGATQSGAAMAHEKCAGIFQTGH